MLPSILNKWASHLSENAAFLQIQRVIENQLYLGTAYRKAKIAIISTQKVMFGHWKWSTLTISSTWIYQIGSIFENFEPNGDNATSKVHISSYMTGHTCTCIWPDGVKFPEKKWYQIASLKLCIMKCREMWSKVTFAHLKKKWYQMSPKKLSIGLIWREMQSTVIFGHLNWPAVAISPHELHKMGYIRGMAYRITKRAIVMMVSILKHVEFQSKKFARNTMVIRTGSTRGNCWESNIIKILYAFLMILFYYTFDFNININGRHYGNTNQSWCPSNTNNNLLLVMILTYIE